MLILVAIGFGVFAVVCAMVVWYLMGVEEIEEGD